MLRNYGDEWENLNIEEETGQEESLVIEGLTLSLGSKERGSREIAVADCVPECRT